MGILDFLFPKTCVECGRMGRYLCSECVNRLVQSGQVCPMCSKGSVYGLTHTKCKKVLGMDGLVRVVKYKGVARSLVSKLKYKLVTDMVDEIFEVMMSMGDFLALEKGDWLVVPVPLHKSRERWRGFNQAQVLGERASGYFGWELGDRVLLRVRDTKPQVKLKKKERLENVRGAFALGSKAAKLQSSRVLLVDDVWTSGATMRECAKVLKRNGAGEVWGLVLAA